MGRIPNIERDSFLGMPKAIFSGGGVQAWNVLESTQAPPHPQAGPAGRCPFARVLTSPQSSQPSIRHSHVPGCSLMLQALKAVLPKHLCVISVYRGDSWPPWKRRIKLPDKGDRGKHRLPEATFWKFIKWKYQPRVTEDLSLGCRPSLICHLTFVASFSVRHIQRSNIHRGEGGVSASVELSRKRTHVC